MTSRILLASIFASFVTIAFSSCAQEYKVTKAPHRKAVTGKVAGVVEHSHPVKVSKNIGIGQTAGGLGGALAGANVGAGTGRYVGAVIGRFIGAYGGKIAETRYREEDAQEVMVKLKGKSYKLISLSEAQFKTGDKIWANTNVYGEPITISPR